MASVRQAVGNSSQESDTSENAVEQEDDTDAEEVYEVEKIIGVQRQNGETRYKVRWASYSPSWDTWEPVDHLDSCKDLITAYEEEQQRKKEQRKESRRLSSEHQKTDSTPAITESPKVRDSFWDDLQAGKINVFDNDLYSKVKGQGRSARPSSFKELFNSPVTMSAQSSASAEETKKAKKRKKTYDSCDHKRKKKNGKGDGKCGSKVEMLTDSTPTVSVNSNCAESTSSEMVKAKKKVKKHEKHEESSRLVSCAESSARKSSLEKSSNHKTSESAMSANQTKSSSQSDIGQSGDVRSESKKSKKHKKSSKELDGSFEKKAKKTKKKEEMSVSVVRLDEHAECSRELTGREPSSPGVLVVDFAHKSTKSDEVSVLHISEDKLTEDCDEIKDLSTDICSLDNAVTDLVNKAVTNAVMGKPICAGTEDQYISQQRALRVVEQENNNRIKEKNHTPSANILPVTFEGIDKITESIMSASTSQASNLLLSEPVVPSSGDGGDCSAIQPPFGDNGKKLDNDMVKHLELESMESSKSKEEIANEKSLNTQVEASRSLLNSQVEASRSFTASNLKASQKAASENKPCAIVSPCTSAGRMTNKRIDKLNERILSMCNKEKGCEDLLKVKDKGSLALSMFEPANSDFDLTSFDKLLEPEVTVEPAGIAAVTNYKALFSQQEACAPSAQTEEDLIIDQLLGEHPFTDSELRQLDLMANELSKSSEFQSTTDGIPPVHPAQTTLLGVRDVSGPQYSQHQSYPGHTPVNQPVGTNEVPGASSLSVVHNSHSSCSYSQPHYNSLPQSKPPSYPGHSAYVSGHVDTDTQVLNPLDFPPYQRSQAFKQWRASLSRGCNTAVRHDNSHVATTSLTTHLPDHHDGASHLSFNPLQNNVNHSQPVSPRLYTGNNSGASYREPRVAVARTNIGESKGQPAAIMSSSQGHQTMIGEASRSSQMTLAHQMAPQTSILRAKLAAGNPELQFDQYDISDSRKDWEEEWRKSIEGFEITDHQLKDSVKKGDYMTVSKALCAGRRRYNLEQPDATGMSLVMIAAQKGYDDILEVLVQHGASINTQQKNGNTALMYAAEQGHTCTVSIILSLGAYLNTQQCTGETALMKAVKKGHRNVVKLLLENGVNFGHQSTNDSSAFSLARSYSRHSISDLISHFIAKVTAVFEDQVNVTLNNTARVAEAIFPLQCFALRESTTFRITFKHELQPTVTGVGMILFIAHARINPEEIRCRFYGPCAVKSVILNDVQQPALTEEANFVLSFSPLHNGANELIIQTVHAPTTKAKLLVCAYRATLSAAQE